jgi:hypothetical protein
MVDVSQCVQHDLGQVTAKRPIRRAGQVPRETLSAFTVRLETDLYKRLGHLAVDAEVSLNDIVRLVLTDFLASDPKAEQLVQRLRSGGS